MAAVASAELTFVEEDEHIARAVHVDSENKEPSDVDSSASEDSSDETEDEDDNTEDGNDQEYSNLQWSCHVQAPGGMDSNEDVVIKVHVPANSTCIDYFHLFFTDHVYQLIASESIRFEWQKGELDVDLSGSLQNFGVPELKAWLGLTLAMGLVKKINLKSYWSSNAVKNTPLFANTMARDHYLAILRFLHFVNNDNAPDPADPNRDKLWKIRPFLNILLPRFTSVYSATQDETLIKFKGRVQFRQFLPWKRS